MNPEIRKNIWLELSITRVAALLGAYLVILASILNSRHPLDSYGSFACMALVAFMLFAFVRCSASVATEVQDNTWDFQRMSSVGAWELTLGKIVGAPIFATWGAVIAFVLILLVMIAQGTAFGIVCRLIIILPSAFIFMCAAGVGRSLLAAQEMRGQRRVKANTGGVAMVLVLFLLTGPIVALTRILGENLSKSDGLSTAHIIWWGIEFLAFDFITLSVVLFTLWSVLGAYRLMRSELQFKQPPTAWILFCSFLWFYLTPLWSHARAADPTFAALSSLPGPLLFSMLLYPDLCSGFKDIISLRQFVAALTCYDLHRAFSLIPRWMISLLFFITAAAISIIASLSTTGSALMTAWILFVIRDVGVVMSFHIRAPNHRRNGVAALVYFAFAYGLGPILFATVQRHLAGLFFPIDPFYSLVGGAIGVTVALHLVKDAWVVSSPTGGR